MSITCFFQWHWSQDIVHSTECIPVTGMHHSVMVKDMQHVLHPMALMRGFKYQQTIDITEYIPVTGMHCAKSVEDMQHVPHLMTYIIDSTQCIPVTGMYWANAVGDVQYVHHPVTLMWGHNSRAPVTGMHYAITIKYSTIYAIITLSQSIGVNSCLIALSVSHLLGCTARTELKMIYMCYMDWH